ncbi:unnamed protein product [Adineta steineri]|uniref:peptidylglycine monooxygenase n=1 Tax=Adineta steineri TaxID=433720 RepID=A0A813SCU7_9BILA|nr:unnamed protein product [Adineta steineri]CAF3674720.1 unnamed protein product [Adineta steineri]
MNNYETTKEDEYVSIQYKLSDEELLIVGFIPLINMRNAHHMLTYICEEPAEKKLFWSGNTICNGEQTIIHGWSKNAPPFILPKDVGFAVGRNTPYKYIVVNIHYFSLLKNDYSGNQLILTHKSRKSYAGVILSGTNQIYLKENTQTIRTPFSCQYKGPTISIFAASVHTHQWGRVNSLYRVHDYEISLIIKMNPQNPQSFYRLLLPVEIKNNDYIIGQCVYDNNLDKTIHIGETHNDEMCNIYAMYSYNLSQKSINNPHPFPLCWDNAVSQMANLIPEDSIIPPLKLNYINQTTDDEQYISYVKHSMNLSRDLPIKIFNQQNYFIIIITILISFLILLIIGRCMGNLQYFSYMRHGDIINRRKGFQILKQSSDQENDLLD